MLIDLFVLILLTPHSPFVPVPVSHHRTSADCEQAYKDMLAQGTASTSMRHSCTSTVVVAPVSAKDIFPNGPLLAPPAAKPIVTEPRDAEWLKEKCAALPSNLREQLKGVGACP